VKFRTEVRADATALARAVAEAIAELSERAANGTVTIALSGGSTPKKLYEALAAAPLYDRVVWKNLEFFFGDERSVPPEHPDSNYGMAAKALLTKISIAEPPHGRRAWRSGRV